MNKSHRTHGRLAFILLVSTVFLLINFFTRLVLLGYEVILQDVSASSIPVIFLTGGVFDLAALAYAIVPILILSIVVPNGDWGRKVYTVVSSALFVVMVGSMLFVSVSELIFWNEFTSRFNFIAVDYLIYTREVIGNIRESYPVGWVFSAIGLIAVVILLMLRKRLKNAFSDNSSLAKLRIYLSIAVFVLPMSSFFFVGDRLSGRIDDNIDRELAGNGYYDFFSAFRNNNLDYFSFYRTMPIEKAAAILHKEYGEDAGSTTSDSSIHELSFPRKITSTMPEKHLNVVLVSIESLGSDYVESFGGRKGLTPNLDKLAAKGLKMTRVYATGLRTVRGLEALTLSIPPTPGHAVLKRKKNKGLQTIGSIFKNRGYDILYLYGGYSYFDNMNSFFSGNGYEVIDRTDIKDKKISHENIWGVADEDLYKKTLREIDARTASGKKVFAHVMTTSNHRPFTYPEDRIDIASGSGREGAVKYTDWAIGDFMREASTRPWFKDTVFIFVADHTSNGRGHTDLPPENYRIPLIFYSPGNINPGSQDYMMSLIDVPTTLLGMLDFSYESYFFGINTLEKRDRLQRAFMANYLTVGYMQDNVIIELSPNQGVNIRNAKTGKQIDKDSSIATNLTDKAIAYYEMATVLLNSMATD